MNNWGTFGVTGIIWGLALCAVTVPLLACAQLIFRQRLRAYWLLVCAAVTVYVTGVVCFTMLPLGSSGVVCSRNPVQLVPFSGLATILAESQESGLAGVLTGHNFLQIFFNVLLFVPGGFILRAVFKRGIVTTGLLAAGGSLLIETTQLTGLWGYYPCAYRIFDADDLITNTLGVSAVRCWRPAGLLPAAARNTSLFHPATKVQGTGAEEKPVSIRRTCHQNS